MKNLKNSRPLSHVGRGSKPPHLHPEGKRKEEMIEEDCETATRKKAKVEEKRKMRFSSGLSESHICSLIEQLSKTASYRISIPGLLLTSERTRERFLNIFEKSFIDASITPDRLENMVARVSTPRVITFSEEEIPEGDTIHNRAIYVTARHSICAFP